MAVQEIIRFDLDMENLPLLGLFHCRQVQKLPRASSESKNVADYSLRLCTAE